MSEWGVVGREGGVRMGRGGERGGGGKDGEGGREGRELYKNGEGGRELYKNDEEVYQHLWQQPLGYMLTV